MDFDALLTIITFSRIFYFSTLLLFMPFGAHPDGEVDPLPMTIHLPMTHVTGTSKVRLHCGTNMLTLAWISDMEPYPSPRDKFRMS